MGADHEEINTAGQTKQESNLWPSDWGPFAIIITIIIIIII